MMRSTKTMSALLGSLLLLLLPPLSHWSANATGGAHGATRENRQYTEYTFSQENGRWTRSWFQCDEARSVALVLDFPESGPHRYLDFKKDQPAQQNIKGLSPKHDADCGMMKCWWTFTITTGATAANTNRTSPVAPSTFAIEESHYYNPEDGYWTSKHRVGVGSSEEEAEGQVQPCRWFPRTRAAIVTNRRTLYITETKAGGLEFRAYEFKLASNQPSLFLTGGKSSLSAGGEIESFTFKNRGYTYILNVGARDSRPSAQLLIKKNNVVIQEEKVLSYTYLKKS